MNRKEETEVNETIKVLFVNTYIGDLGAFYKGNIYELTNEQYKLFRNDSKEIK
jgi:hypothetical protein